MNPAAGNAATRFLAQEERQSLVLSARTLPESTDAWNRILEVIRPTISNETFANWLEPVECSHISGEGQIHLVAPNSDAQDWLESEFEATILQAAGSIGIDLQAIRIEAAEPEPRLVQQSFRFEQDPAQFNDRYTFDRFVVGSCNEFAHAASQAVASKPAAVYNPLYLYSGVGMGKTHLLHAIGHTVQRSDPRLKIVYVSAEEFMNEMIRSIKFNGMRKFHERFRTADALLVDDIQVLGSKERTQEEFFHTFNALHNRGKQIVLSSDSNPEAIAGLVDRLKSRFSWGLMADIQPPDLETKMAILGRKAEEAGIVLPDDVCSFIATRPTSNIRDLEGVLNRLIARAQFINSRITLGMARSLFASLGPVRPAGPSIDAIQHAVATEFGIPVSDLATRNNSRRVALPRQVAMYLCRKLAGASLSEVGRTFGKHHTTVLHSVNKIESSIATDSALRSRIVALKDGLENHKNYTTFADDSA